MRIAVISEGFYPEVSGVTIAVVKHLDFLARQGHELLLVHPRYPEDVVQRLRLSLPAPPVLPASVQRLEFASDPIAPHRPESRIPSRLGAREIDAALLRFAPAVILYHNADRLVPELAKFWKPRQVAGIAASRQLGAAAVPIIHTLMPLFVERSGQWFWRTPPAVALTRRIFSAIYNQNFEFALTVDPAARDYLQGIGIRRPILAGSFNGVDTSVFQARAARQRPSGAPLRICWIGRLVPEKNAPLLPHLVAALHRLAVPFELVLVGDGPLAEPLRRQLPAGSGVTFTGWLAPAAVAAELCRADVYLSVSDTESCSLTANEALASAVPVIAPEVIGFRRLAAIGAGLLFPADWLRPSAMGQLAALLGDSRARLAQWSRRAAAVAPELSWERALSALYTTLGTKLGQQFL